MENMREHNGGEGDIGVQENLRQRWIILNGEISQK